MTARIRPFVRRAAPVLVFLALGCSSTYDFNSPAPVVKLSTVRPAPTDRATVNLEISRQTLKAATEQPGALRSMRVVQVFKGSDESGTTYPEYRIFNIAPGTAPQLLGFENGDVLVSASDYVVYNPDAFRRYLAALWNEPAAEIEIRREGKPVLLKYTFVN